MTSLTHFFLLDATTSWAWGWDALVALGTIGLALGTVWLAWTTRASVRAARDEQSAAWRPVLIVKPEMSFISMAEDGPSDVEFNVSNEGRGPAMMIDATLSYSVDLKPKEARADRIGVLSVNQPRSVRFSLPSAGLDRFAEVKMTYIDLAQRRYWSNSLVGIDAEASPGRIEAVGAYFQDGRVGDLVPPLPGRIESRLTRYRHRRKLREANDRATKNGRVRPTQDSVAHAEDESRGQAP